MSKRYIHRREDLADAAAFKTAVDAAVAADPDAPEYPAGELWIVGPDSGATVICTVVQVGGVPTAHTVTTAVVV